MAKNIFGGIELGGVLGGYEIVDVPATKLPQDVSSAVSAANSAPLLGATYNPIWYVGFQTVNGKNHLFIAEEIRVTKNKDKCIVGLVINVPPGEKANEGAGARIVTIIEDEPLDPEVETAFAEVGKGLVGVSLKSVMNVGKQPAKGTNHFIVAESKVIYPGAEPRAVIVEINIFEGKAAIVGISSIGASKDSLFGYAFNW